MALRLVRDPLAGLVLAAVGTLVLAAGVRPLGAEGQPPSPGQAAADQPAEESTPEEDPLGPNGACYVCHVTFVKEELAKSHLAHKIGCVKCHGLSDKHANDEHVGATKPDVTFTRDKIDEGCKKCHRAHDVPAAQVVARFVDRHLAPQASLVCADCHGTHKIDRSAATK